MIIKHVCRSAIVAMILTGVASSCLAQAPVLNINQPARLSNGTKEPICATTDLSKWFAFEETAVGKSRYDAAKKSGEDPDKYLKWIEKDKARRAKMVADKQLLLIPYNTKVKVLKYKEDKQVQEAVIYYTGRTVRYGRFEVEVLEGEHKGRKVWTKYVVDATRPNVGDDALLVNTNEPNARVAVAFDEGQLHSYRDSVTKGNTEYAGTLVNLKLVFIVEPKTKCEVVATDVYLVDKVLYFQVRITEGDSAGKLVWCPYVSLETSEPSTP